MSKQIIIIDDDRFLSDSISRLLESNEFAVRRGFSAEEGYQAIKEEQPDLLILDLGLPDLDGVSLCRRIRTEYRFPILMLTSRTESIDKVVGLEAGADDYLTKPFDAHELLARTRALLRRSTEYVGENVKKNRIEIGALSIDLDERTVRINESELDLTSTEYKIIEYLAINRGRAISRDQLFEKIWGYDIEFSSNSLDVLIYRLRAKTEKQTGQKLIQTIRGYGYKITVE